MLGKELIDTESFRGARKVVKRRIAFAQGDSVAEVLEDGQEFAEAPDAGVVKRLGGASALAPEPFECARVGAVAAFALAPAGIFDFKEIAALGAAKVGTRFGAGHTVAASKAAELV
jgi:hypothetical protein